MKKETVFVRTKNRDQANMYAEILKKMGQKIRPDFNSNTELNDPDLDYRDSGWILGFSTSEKKEITFGQLVDLLSEPKKIAVKVENEKEFKALLKYYNYLGWKWQANDHCREIAMQYYHYPFSLEFNNNFNWGKSRQDDYQIIPFSEFAAEHGIKLPLITSEDGVDLYEGDIYYYVYITGCNWELMNNNKERASILSEMANVIKMPTNYKAFSTKQVALDWIEEQNPKSAIISMNNHTQETEVFKDGKILIRYAGMEIPIHYYDLSRMEGAYKRLNS